eukprot:Filipodium_phascolosomae@DN4611_c0_g1_i1.p1
MDFPIVNECRRSPSDSLDSTSSDEGSRPRSPHCEKKHSCLDGFMSSTLPIFGLMAVASSGIFVFAELSKETCQNPLDVFLLMSSGVWLLGFCVEVGSAVAQRSRRLKKRSFDHIDHTSGLLSTEDDENITRSKRSRIIVGTLRAVFWIITIAVTITGSVWFLRTPVKGCGPILYNGSMAILMVPMLYPLVLLVSFGVLLIFFAQTVVVDTYRSLFLGAGKSEKESAVNKNRNYGSAVSSSGQYPLRTECRTDQDAQGTRYAIDTAYPTV